MDTEKFYSTLSKLHMGISTLGPQNSSSRGKMAIWKVCLSALLSSIDLFSFVCLQKWNGWHEEWASSPACGLGQIQRDGFSVFSLAVLWTSNLFPHSQNSFTSWVILSFYSIQLHLACRIDYTLGTYWAPSFQSWGLFLTWKRDSETHSWGARECKALRNWMRKHWILFDACKSCLGEKVKEAWRKGTEVRMLGEASSWRQG